MRDLKFRGKRIDNGQWVYGDLIQSKPNKVDGKHSSWIIEKTIMPFGAVSTPTEKFIQVDPETVGQFTGLIDKNGKEIYEGDILKSGRTGLLYEVKHDNESASFMSFCTAPDKDFCMNPYAWPTSEVIGNIHENSELLK